MEEEVGDAVDMAARKVEGAQEQQCSVMVAAKAKS